MNSSFLFRIRILVGVFVFVILLVVAKLFYIQIIHKDTYTEKADRQYATPVGSMFDRGSIYFSTKDNTLVSAATLKTLFKIAIKPKEIVDPEATFSKLQTYIPLEHEEFMKQVAKVEDPYEEIAVRQTKEVADSISLAKIPGVYIYKEKTRFYPGDSLASHVLGFVAYKEDELSGRYGLERSYDETLSRGKESVYMNFFAEIFANIHDTIFTREEKDGDLVLSIEPQVQTLLEDELVKAVERYGADFAGGMIIDPRTGDMIAMARVPGYDLNAFKEVTNPLLYGNTNVENVYEFGSVIKPLTIASGIDAGVITPETSYNDQGFVILNTKRINNFDLKGRGPGTTMQDVLNESLNTGSVFVMQKLGHDKFRDYMMSFGIGEKTGIDLPNETTGLVSNLKSTREIEYATAAFGQGIALTPIEALRAFTVFANDGRYVTPHLVKEIKYTDGTSYKTEVEESEQVISEESAFTITKMLTVVADTMMKTYGLSFPHYSLAVKTGTAQVALESGGGYYDDKHLHSIFGYFPAYEPRFLIFMYIMDPKGVKYSAQTLSGPLVNTAKYLSTYYNVPPDSI